MDALVRYPRAEVRLGGPVALERVGGEWRIVDYVRDGRRALEQVHLPLATVQRSGPAELTVVAVRESPKVDTVVATLRNDGDEPLRVTRAFGFVRGAWRAGAVQARVEAPPSGAVTFWAGVWTSEDAPRVAYELRCGGKAIWLDVAPRLDGAREEQPPPRRRPRGLLRPRRALLQPAAVIVAPLVLVAALGPSGWLTGLLLAYVVGFGWAGVQIARGSGVRAASLAFGLAGAMLVPSSRSGRSSGAPAAATRLRPGARPTATRGRGTSTSAPARAAARSAASSR